MSSQNTPIFFHKTYNINIKQKTFKVKRCHKDQTFIEVADYVPVI